MRLKSLTVNVRVESKWHEPEFKKTTKSSKRMPTTQANCTWKTDWILLAGLRRIRKAESERGSILRYHLTVFLESHNPVTNNESDRRQK